MVQGSGAGGSYDRHGSPDAFLAADAEERATDGAEERGWRLVHREGIGELVGSFALAPRSGEREGRGAG
jgi:hypothetical protein